MPTKTTKKAPTKKPAKKIVKPAAAVKPTVSEIPLPDPYCHCTKHKRNTILICVSTCAFLIGFFVSQLFFCGPCGHKPQFVNGCLDVTSIHCPKMLEELPMIDADHDGCITKQELKASKRAMHHHKRPEPGAEPAVNAEDAIAPVME